MVKKPIRANFQISATGLTDTSALSSAGKKPQRPLDPTQAPGVHDPCALP